MFVNAENNFTFNAPKINDIREYFEKNKKDCGRIKNSILLNGLNKIEGVFNFGEITDEWWSKICSDFETYADSMRDNYFVMPLNNFAFRVRLQSSKGYAGLTYVYFTDFGKIGESVCTRILCFAQKHNGHFNAWGGTSYNTYNGNPMSFSNFESLADPSEDIRQKEIVLKEQINKNTQISVVLPVFALNLILNTKNIPKTTEIPSPKLQTKRAKEGKPPLPYTTNINLGAYMIARNNTESGNTGTHASPRPHLRRAHLRTIMRGEETITIPVQQCMVNWDGGSPLMREEYKVKTTNLEK